MRYALHSDELGSRAYEGETLLINTPLKSHLNAREKRQRTQQSLNILHMKFHISKRTLPFRAGYVSVVFYFRFVTSTYH